MTAQSAIPLKWYVPFATGDASRVEIPVTSSDATRASQTLGFPPLTMQPPAVGGVPPQGEDFNGALNQVARVAWWTLNGGGWPYDATFATNASIGGYPNGAVLQSADFLGQWISTADNNQNNPDTSGTNWVPGFQYGSTSLTGQTGGTVTLTPLQAAKRSIAVSGTLGSALVLVFPTWLKDWSITNNTTGAFTVIAKTAAGSGVTIPQNGSPTAVAGDGTNINQPAQNIAQGTAAAHAMTIAQGAGVIGSARNLSMTVTAVSASATMTADEIIVETALGGTRYCLPSFSQTINLATTGAGGMDTGSAPASGYVALYAIYNPTSGARALLATNATAARAANVYSGANMPSGYTASGLVSVWPTNASGQLLIGNQNDRSISIQAITQLNAASVTSPTLLTLTAPFNAKSITGFLQGTTTSSQQAQIVVAADAVGTGSQIISGYTPAGTQSIYGNFGLQLTTPRTLYWNGNAATFTAIIGLSGYTI